jgi:hypothetical protein
MERFGDVILAKRVTQDALNRLLGMPLMWDHDGSREFSREIPLIEGVC